MAASPTTAETDAAAAVGLLIYDGDCGFCTNAARWVVDHSQGRVTSSPAHRVDPAAYGLTADDLASAAYWIEGDAVHRGADATLRSLQQCERPWSIIGRVLAVPPLIWIGRAVYPLVAKYRHRLPGATDACRLD